MKNDLRDRAVIDATAELIDVFQLTLLTASQELPSTRCISHASLVPIIQRTQKALTSGTFRTYSAVRIIAVLESAELLRRLPLTSPRGRPVKIYVLGFNETSQPSALEVMQAYRPAGTLCYFSALELHGLTTQPTPHYHLAEFRPGRASSAVEPPAESSDKPQSLGVEVFTLEDVKCFLTSRDPNNLQGIQRRQLHSQCTVRVTTLEQTLLDCLHRPRSAGGPAVVFEAWASGLPRSNAAKLWALLDSIQNPNLMRRAGYMLEYHQTTSALLDQIRSALRGFPTDQPPESLLPGIPYSNTANDWHLRTP
ncbi:TPA: hypothetical protein UMF74_001046 [Stenotrophomonas maltophilia]|jgi:hypothetical protein|nr:hypothetical protein [Stenotrophomonas maltophilia]